MYQIDFNKPCRVHFIGIGGISMSGLAEILLEEGFTVSGSDMKDSDLCRHLQEAGARVTIGQAAENIEDPDVVVFTAAIHPDNPEFAAARDRGIPMLSRAELLGELMKNYGEAINVAGTHGKTTTTSMISEILLQAGKDPTITVGGMLPSIGGNIRVGGSDYFVAEACEYTNSFLSFFPTVSVILNVEADHLDFFKDIDDIRHSFREFILRLPQDERGLLVFNGDIREPEYFLSGLGCRVLAEAEEGDFWASLPLLRRRCGDRACLRAAHFFRENARTAAEARALQAGRFGDFLAMVRESGHDSFTLCQNVYSGADPHSQSLSVALAVSERLLKDSGGAWRMQGGGFAGTIQAFVPAACLETYRAAMDGVFGPGSCHVLALREEGAGLAF